MKLLSIILLSALCTTSAYAIGSGLQSQKVPSRTISFDDLKMACQNPARYHNQIAPTNIQIGCQDVQLKWVADKESAIAGTTARQITALAYSDKYSVEAVTAVMDSNPQSLACPRFKQVAEKMETMRSISCNELLSFKGSITDFCSQTLTSVKGANPAAVTLTDTGKVVDLCNNSQAYQQK